LSKSSSTEALLDGALDEEPLKITSAIDSPLKFLAEISPITHLTASIILDLPHPLGPTTPDMLEGKLIFVGSTKDLKPERLIFFNRICSFKAIF
jgi:hypothetical protein